MGKISLREVGCNNQYQNTLVIQVRSGFTKWIAFGPFFYDQYFGLTDIPLYRAS